MFLDIFLFLVIAGFLTILFAGVFRRVGPWESVFAFFIVLFLAIWAISLWLAPAGPVFLGVYWFPVIIIGFILALLLAASAPPRPPRTAEEAVEEAEKEAAAERSIDALFWVLLVILLLAILGRGFVWPGA
ncbi:MAG: hypothetical protein GF408_00870 [Candidatus Omnitrophica bacterium]|nr:hypothetical protein [Candidatus Omnitrophota bacterium]